MTTIDKTQFGPWALITGASSGIGREFARQIAASGINVVLVARREALLEELGRALATEFGVVVSNAGTPHPGAFLKIDRSELEKGLRLNTLAHLDIAHHFGQRLAKRGQGGLLLVGAMGSENGVPYMANDGAAKAFVHSLGEALHIEFRPLGIYVTVLSPGFTDTPVLAKLGLTTDTMPMKPMKAEQCVSEGLKAIQENRSMIIPGRMNRIMNAVVPASVTRTMEAKMLSKALANKSTAPQTHADVR